MNAPLSPLPDGRAEVRSFGVDESRNKVLAYGVFHGTHTGEGGPVAPTGKSAKADYVYAMDFEGDKIRHAAVGVGIARYVRQAGLGETVGSAEAVSRG